MSNVESESPRNLLERACDAGLSSAEGFLKLAGFEDVKVFVAVHARGSHERFDSASGGSGYEDGRELLAELLGAASGMAERLGLRMDVIPNLKGKGGVG